MFSLYCRCFWERNVCSFTNESIFKQNFRANIKYNYKNITLKELVEDLNEDVNNAAKGENLLLFLQDTTIKRTKHFNMLMLVTTIQLLINKKKLFLNKGCIGLGNVREIQKLK
jgi:hypothetical protein